MYTTSTSDVNYSVAVAEAAAANKKITLGVKHQRLGTS